MIWGYQRFRTLPHNIYINQPHPFKERIYIYMQKLNVSPLLHGLSHPRKIEWPKSLLLAAYVMRWA